ncbi:PepSY domain-containing protein [Catenovulum sp. SM1970]|uniref:PepSY-associated TM helix domain-containing protein n=1 Tax=Marinifaba aquimaris TaxID=2741323 RepID=UPI001572AEEB|nr:PepSY-associated TM helix domain-containing protein [Marinifaba aquimaris]NTS78050.1 PepSY domain-containing protein [Marinifaba aquimaris]
MKVRSDVLRTYQSLHTWTGIVAGLVLFIGFYAGALTMFKPVIEHWATPSYQHLAQIEQSQWQSLIERTTEQYEKARIGFTLQFDPDKSPLTWFEKGGGRGIRLDDQLMHASLDTDGELIVHSTSTNELGTLIDQLHRTAGIPGSVGHEDLGVLILGVAAFLYFLALVSGLIFLLPTLTKSLFSVRADKGASRFWLDSHNLVGVMSFPFHVIIAWTAVVFAFHDVLYGGLAQVYGDKPLFERTEQTEAVYRLESLPKVEDYIAHVAKIAPGYQIQSLAFSDLNSATPSLAIEATKAGQMQRGGYSDYIYMHPFTFEVGYTSVFTEPNSEYGPIVNSFFALHFGNYAGDFGRWMYFVFGLLGAYLFYSGNLLWLDKRQKKQAKSGTLKTSTKVMANLTVSVCLGSILAVMLCLISTKWLYLFSQQINSHYLTIYYSCFALCILYSFYKGAARSAIGLLKLLFLACLAIPFTSLASLLIAGLDHQLDIAHISFDLIALLFASFFYWLRQKALKRALLGQNNSIWSLPKTDKYHQRGYQQKWFKAN